MTPPLTALIEALRPIRLAVDRLQWMERGCACIVNLDDLREAAAALSAFEAEPQGWRAIDENTPAYQDLLLLSMPAGKYGIGSYSVLPFEAKPDRILWDWGWGYKPTHWQPLPLPPEPRDE